MIASRNTKASAGHPTRAFVPISLPRRTKGDVRADKCRHGGRKGRKGAAAPDPKALTGHAGRPEERADAPRLLLRRQRADVGQQVVLVAPGQPRPDRRAATHRRRQPPPIRRDALGDRAQDLLVGPAPDPALRMRADVARLQPGQSLLVRRPSLRPVWDAAADQLRPRWSSCPNDGAGLTLHTRLVRPLLLERAPDPKPIYTAPREN